MMEQILEIGRFMVEAFTHIWPYLIVTIPIAVAVQMSGASKYISRAFAARPVVAILLATLVGAFSPFCSCGVIPVVAALLISGVPLAPVMAFWVASPSMDPEIFFLSVGALGWELAVWRLGSTLVLSLAAGFVTHFMVGRGWLGQRILRAGYTTEVRSRRAIVRGAWNWLQGRLRPAPALAFAAPVRAGVYLVPVSPGPAGNSPELSGSASGTPAGSCSSGACALPPAGPIVEVQTLPTGEATGERSFRARLLAETWAATAMVIKFMALAFFLEALITLYVPEAWIIRLLGSENGWAIPAAALLGVPIYTSNLAALPLIGGLLAQGMAPAAALAFLIAGPTTTLPAMAAVWGLATRRVFALYVSFSLVGAILLGAIYSLVS